MGRAREGCAAVAVLAVVGALLVAPETATAAPPSGAVALAGVADATLSGITTSTGSNVGPDFTAANHYYQVTTDNPALTLTATSSEVTATITAKLGGVTQPVSNGAVALSLERGRNEVLFTVTAPNGIATEAYHVAVWLGIVPVPTIVQISNPTATVFGGSRTTVTVRDGTPPPWPWCYGSSVYVGDNEYGDIEGNVLDPDTGLTRLTVEMPDINDHVPGVYDLHVKNECQFGSSVATSHKAITYVDDFPVTSTEAPDPLTAGKVIKFHGKNVTNMADDIDYWIANDDRSKIIELEPYEYWAGDDVAAVMVEYDNDDEYIGSGKRRVYVGSCPNNLGDADCRVFYSKEINWVAPAPTDVSFSPASGPVAGGTKVRLRGRFLSSNYPNLTIKFGDQPVTSSVTRIQSASWEDEENIEAWSTGYDVVEIDAPPATAPGSVALTVSSQFGSTVARGTFTYGARPVITAVSPSTVANSGGSVISLTGTGFGTAGRPSVIINGVKSPYVTRVSATKVTAVVPASADTGAVDVRVVSAQGGGTSEAAALTLAAPSTTPTVSGIAPSSAKPGDSVTITGTGFGAAGTVGVSVGDVWARVTASTATSVTIDVPVVDTPGAKTVLVGTTTGAVSSASLTVLAQPAITDVAPAAIASYATGSAAKVRLTGVGFGTTGKVKVGDAAAVSYTATSNGTIISDVVVPTGAAGSLPIAVTPTGATDALRSTVRVTGPTITYVGGDPHNEVFEDVTLDDDDRGVVLESPVTGGARMRVEGTGFGTSGTVKVGTTTVTPLSYTDTAIVLKVPAHAVGNEGVTVIPGGGTAVSVSRALAVRYVAAIVRPSIVRVMSSIDLGHATRSDFDPIADLNDTFTLTGTDLIGSSASTTRIIVSEGNGDNPLTVVPKTVTASTVTFSAPRTFTSGGWKRVTVVTDVGSAYIQQGINYSQAGMTLNSSATSGLCLRQQQSASGGVTHSPASVTITNSGTAFGNAGTVSMDGVAITPDSYTSASIAFDMADLTADLASPWGAKTILITPTDTSLPAQRVGFTCVVAVSAATTANGSANHLTVDAGTAFTMGYTTTGFIGANAFTVVSPGGYEYVTAAQHTANGFASGVRSGVPSAAGDYFIRVALSRATYASDRHRFTADPTAVQVTITGKPITLTPQSTNGATFVYRGKLTGGATAADITYTVQSSITPDPITAVVWEYRNSSCDQLGPDEGWSEGLPKNVAMGSASCGGDPTVRVAWDVRVKSFEMKAAGADKSGLYMSTRPALRITITPKPLTVSAVRADRVYNGTDLAEPNSFTLPGVLTGDDVGLDHASGGGTFADATAGLEKPVTLATDVTLAGSSAVSYSLTNPRPTVVGTIAKADAKLGLQADRASVLLSQNTPVNVTATVTDTRTGQAPPNAANVAAVTLASETPSVCTISHGVVTAAAPGTCEISGQQAASANYNAATAVTDGTSAVEYTEFQVFAAPQTISVMADDLVVAYGDPVNPTAQFTGLFDGDTVTNLEFQYYQGNVLMQATPTEPGTYRIVPLGGTLTAASDGAYTNPTSFRAVAGSLVITPVPPTITSLSPSSGWFGGGTKVTINGTLLGTVRSLRIGDTTIRIPDFQVNADGTQITFRTPAVGGPATVTITLVAGTAETDETYNYVAEPDPTPSPSPSPSASPTPTPIETPTESPSPSVSPSPSGSPSPSASPSPSPTPSPSTTPTPPPTTTPPGPVQLDLNLDLKADSKLVGASAVLTGGGLRPASDYVLTMNSTPVVIATGKTNGTGGFRATITMPGKACVRGGLHELVLTGIAPDGTTVRDSNWIVLDDSCTASETGSGTTKPKDFVVPLGWFIFPYQSAYLSPTAKRSIRGAVSAMRGAKVVTVTGYTQTKKQSKAAKRANKKLAMRRAVAVRNYLRKLGVRTTIKTVGAGGVDPVSGEKQYLNRRVTIKVRF